MPPARPRNVDDSRSETSSTVTNQKDKSVLGPTSGSGVGKGKRLASNLHASTSANKAAATSTAAGEEGPGEKKDPSLPRTGWDTMSTSVLRTYRIAHRLSVPSTYNHPHADLIYTSSDIALRAPSAVQSRRKLREQRHQQRKLQQAQRNGNEKNTKTSKDKRKLDAQNAQAEPNQSIAKSIEPPDHGPDQADSSSFPSTTHIGPREPPGHLANAVRKHFNAQQLSEADTIARFIYVVQQNPRGVRTEGSGGDGTGYFIGSHGREVRKLDGPGGEVGFRLRFRP
ncbi:hypothetical protein ABEF95_005549 [Exophiala dermatitidis]|uniref:Histone deacetylase complex subunit SAP30 Sin3 binding domain-containing protein n=2 Tax=Exophiala dermatitidis TaxID=5970 RepID=H6C7P4_EXODN|nr:uncharacterized protein HMPREF1120_06876 [Exophiala dermatitidis NIH/UT8656]KAJ4523321.1 hypothetical protein HRR75_001722 [Exophiala dermatitidis]EHY58874.1 hypothetical protein HMPREF1120_06876 [Exophiala dermatitidis NIH/UT8656]KAJ4560290.1 hypothetical protein HRR78_000817 [Exophiala dermatitidis]KAJ4625613.1 hypothetical protein HRR88_004306 [Exophiala dermatitidis]KAJ4640078.1 hypothetical protein HRR89_004316 [Exophiala dermatitidis]